MQHSEKELCIRQRRQKGEKTGYKTIHYNIIPQVETHKGRMIWISPGRTDIKVTEDPCSLNSPVKKRSKEDHISLNIMEVDKRNVLSSQKLFNDDSCMDISESMVENDHDLITMTDRMAS